MRLPIYKALSLGFVLASGLCAASAQQPPVPLSVKNVKENIYVASGGAGSNDSFIVGKNSVIVIDTKTTVDSEKEVLAEIAKVTQKPITTVILTHSDGDHVNGLAALPKGLTIIAQENCKKEMEESLSTPRPAPREYIPTKTVDKKESLTIDGTRIQLLHFAPAHTSGDLIVFLPDQKVVFTGDLILPLPYLPFPYLHLEKHGSSEGWIESVKGMLTLDADTFVSGHGAVQTKAEVQKRLADTQERRDKIKALVAEGKSLDEIKQAVGESTPPAPGVPRPSFTEVVYQELTQK